MARGQSAGAVRIDIVADNSAYTKALRDSRSQLTRFRQQAVRVSKSLARNWKAGALAVVGVGAAMVAGLKSMAAYSAKVVETSRNVGLTTKTLENFRAAMVGDGLAAKQADKALLAFNRRIGQARAGVGEARRALDTLGISLKDSTGAWKTNDVLLKEVTEKLHGLNDEQLAGAAAADLFSDVGKKMAATLVSLGSSYDKAMKSAGRYFTLTQKQHEVNKDLDQKITDFKANLLDLKNRVLADFAPEIATIVENMNDWISALKGNKTVIENFAKGILSIADALGTVAAIIVGMKAGAMAGSFLPGIGTVIGGAVGGLGGYMAKQYATGKFADLFEDMTQNPWERALDDLRANREYANLRSIEGHGMTDRQRAQLQGFYTQENWIRAQSKMWKPPALAAVSSGGSSASESGGSGGSDDASEPEAVMPVVIGSMRDPNFENEKLYNRARIEAIKAKRLGKEYARNFTDGLHEFRVADAGSMGSYWGMFAGGMWDPRQAGKGARIGGSRTYRETPNIGWGGYARNAPNVGWPMLDPSMAFGSAAYDPNAGMWPQARQLSSGAIGGFPWQGGRGAGRDPFVDDMAIDALRRATDEWNNSLKNVSSTISDRQAFSLEPWREAKEQAFELKRAVRDWDGQVQALAATYEGRLAIARGDWLEGMREAKEAMEESKRGANELRSAFDSMGSSIVDNFSSAGDALKQFARELVKIGLQRTIINPIGNALFGAADGSTEGVLGGFFNDIFPAGGVGAGMGAKIGSRSVTIVNNISSTDGPGVRAALAQATPGIVRQAESTIMDNSNRYGQTQRMIRGTR